MAKVEVTIEGYGSITIKRPKKMTKTKFSSVIAEAVTKTCALIVPPPTVIFHPALGMITNGGPIEDKV